MSSINVRKIAAAAGLLLVLSGRAISHPGSSSTSWLLQYEGQSTNQLIWDKRFAGLVNTRVPAALSDQVVLALAGPPDPVVVQDQRYVSMSACRPYDCTERGFLWIDVERGMGLGAYHLRGTLKLASNGITADHIPPQAKLALTSWIYEQSLNVEYVEFIDRAGVHLEMQPQFFRRK